jgi:hypothetical protein
MRKVPLSPLRSNAPPAEKLEWCIKAIQDIARASQIPDAAVTSEDLADFNEAAQDAVGGILDDGGDIDFTYDDATPAITGAVKSDAVTFAKMQNIATDRLIGRDTASSGDPEEIAVGGGIEFTGSQGIQTSAFTGDVTKTAGGTALAIPDNTVTYAKMQDVSATQRVLGRNTAGSGDAEEVTLSQLLDWLGGAAQGDVIYRGAASWDNLAAGTSGQFLQTQGAGANPQWADNASGWQLISQTTSPGTVSTVDFSDAAIADMTELLLVWEAVTVTAGLDLRVAVSTDGGSTFENITFQLAASGVLSAQRQAFIEPANAENNSKQGHCLIQDPPGGFKAIYAHAARSASNASVGMGMAMGTVESTSKIDFVRLATSTSTITGGNIRLYGRP